MLGTVAAVLLCFLPLQVTGLIKTDAKCLSGYEWTFSSIGQSPCDVAAELASVCVGGQFNLQPITSGYIYTGPKPAEANNCRCSSVYYSLLSACAYCQGENYLQWSIYDVNCTTVFVTVYTQPIPDGVKVPAYAYQNVTIIDSFDVTLAQSTKGVESSHLPSSSTPGPKPTSANAGSSSGSGGTVNNTPAIVGGVVGGIIGLGLIGALIAFLVLRSKQQPQLENSSFRLSNASKFTSPARSPPPGSPKSVPDQRSTTYTTADPNISQRQHSPPLNQNMLPHYTGNSFQTQIPQTMADKAHYTGMPEV